VDFLKAGIHGGLSNAVSKFFATGFVNGVAPENNQMPGFPHKEYEDLITSKGGKKPHIIYLDARNLYGYSQKKNLPHSDFKFVDQNSKLYDIMKQSLLSGEVPEMTDEKTNFFVEVDLVVKKEGRHMTDDFPFAPHPRDVHWNELSYNQKQQYMKGSKSKKIPKVLPNQKLIADFCTKRKYVVHAEHLKLMLQEGLKIINVHRILLFHEEDFLYDWVVFCTEQRNLG
jgi:hypothetical protein